MPLFPQIIDCFTPDPNTDYDFIGIKIGDVNNSVVANRPNNRPIAELSWPHTRAAVGGTITIPVVYTGAGQLDAIQMGLRFDPSRLQLIGPSQGDIESYNLACFNLAEAAQGKIRTLWLPMVDWFEKIQPGAILFYLHFKVLAPSTADSPLRLDPDLLDGAAWTPDGTEYALLAANNPLERSLEQTRPVGSLIASMRPNPSQGATVLEVLSEKAETARIALHDASGKRLFMKEWTLIQGAQEIPLPETENLTTGVYVWKVITRSDMVQGHLVKN